MFLDRILFPITTLGPGNRLVLWTAGCSKHCRGCANPELWSHAGKRARPASEIGQIIRNLAAQQRIDGITVTGGDPLEQPDDLLCLLEAVQDVTEDILVYTGFTYDELCADWQPAQLARLRACCGVLIDGRYVEAQNVPSAVLRGSANQQIIFFREQLRPAYEAYLAKGRSIQNVYMGRQLISVGIHNLQTKETDS